MNKILAVCLMTVFLLPAGSLAQESRLYDNDISYNVLNVLIGTYGLEYERNIVGQYLSVEVSGHYGSRKITENEGAWSKDWSTSWYGGNAALHFYPFGGGLSGVFIGPLYGYDKLTTTAPRSGEQIKFTVSGPMLDIGYRWIWGKVGGGISLSLEFMYGNLSCGAKASDGEEFPLGDRLSGFGCNIGFAF